MSIEKEDVLNVLVGLGTVLVLGIAAYGSAEYESRPEVIEMRKKQREKLEQEREESRARLEKANEAISTLTDREKRELGISKETGYATPSTWTASHVRNFDFYYRSYKDDISGLAYMISKPMDEVAARAKYYKSLGI